MEAETPALDRLIGTVEECIKDAEAASLYVSARLLRMAMIDLVTRANGISEEEFDAVLFALESELCIAEYLSPPELAARRTAVEHAGGNS